MKELTKTQSTALDRLLAIASSDTGQSKRVADFLLSWWNPTACGKWDPTDLWSVDAGIAQDMLTVLGFIADCHAYPNELGYRAQFLALIQKWRPTEDSPA
jgi:hypothetical protein